METPLLFGQLCEKLFHLAGDFRKLSDHIVFFGNVLPRRNASLPDSSIM